MNRKARRWTRVVFVVAIGFALLAPLTAASPVAASPQRASDGPGNGNGNGHGANEIPENAHHDVSPPLRDLAPAPDVSPFQDDKSPKKGLPVPAAGAPDPVIQSTPGTANAPALGLGFEGLGQGFTGPQGTFSVSSAPPDPNGAAGPNHFVEIVNQSFAVFNKSGTAVYGPVPTNTLWAGFGGGCQTNDDGDATVAYDRTADRWVISQFSVSSTPYLQCVAVSTSPDPTGSYYRYSFQYSNFPDYPKLGVWPDAYYTTFNMFNASGTAFLGPEACAYNRAKMLLGQAATQQCFTLTSTYGSLLPSDLDGPTPPPAGSPNFVLSFGTNALQLWKFHVDWTTPANSSLTGPATISVASFSPACSGGGTCIPQSGTSQKLDSLADRLMYRLSYRNFGDHESLVVDHTVTAGSSTGMRWYELRNPNGTPTVYQQGTYAPDSSYRWMGSIAMDHVGDIAMGFSVSSSTLHPEIHYTGRLAGDALGQMTQGEGTVINGAGSQTGQSLSRWGDYTSMSIDPADDCTFWYTDQYESANGAFNWHTRVGTFKFAGCNTVASDFSISASPSSVSAAQGGTATSTISTAVTSGSAQSIALTASGVPAGASASFSPSSVTAGSSSTLTLNAGTAAPGTYTITVTGTAASGSHTTTVSLTVTASDFSLSASPSSVSAAQGGSTTSTISTAVTSGNAQSIALSASGQPAGTTVTFSPASVTAGNSSTMTITVGATAPGTYTITVTGTASSGSHTTSVTLTVTASDFSLNASPSSVSVVQGSSGTSTISTAVTSGSAQSITLSASGQPAATSVSFSPGTVTAGNSSTMTIAVGSSTATGTYTITVTGTAGSGTQTTSVSLTVNPAPPSDFAITANPTSLTVTQGGSATSTIGTAVLSGTAETVSFSASGQPSGTTVSFNPTSVTAGGSSAMTVAVGASTATGSYTITVTGTSTSATHTVSVSLTVSAAPQGVVNGGFETGNLSGWSTSGAFLPVISTTPHTGSYSARIGSTSAVNGNSTLTQTLVVPSGNTTLAFWYQPHCTDTITYDQIQMQIRNTSGTTLQNVLNVCPTTTAWTQVSVDTSAYAGRTIVLWFNDHDDGYAGDPTYFLLDDVAIAASAPPPPNPVQNGGFETGTFSSWSTSGVAAPAIVTTAHSGSYAARFGSPSAYNGQSTLTQTVAVPSGSSTLTFWYQPHCTDTITYDQIQAQIRNTAGTTLATVLNVCSNSGAWTNVSFNMSAYAGQTVVLWFNVHDDGYPSDPTYSVLDDVAIG
jgi:hypothetical protein